MKTITICLFMLAIISCSQEPPEKEKLKLNTNVVYQPTEPTESDTIVTDTLYESISECDRLSFPLLPLYLYENGKPAIIFDLILGESDVIIKMAENARERNYSKFKELQEEIMLYDAPFEDSLLLLLGNAFFLYGTSGTAIAMIEKVEIRYNGCTDAVILTFSKEVTKAIGKPVYASREQRDPIKKPSKKFDAFATSMLAYQTRFDFFDENPIVYFGDVGDTIVAYQDNFKDADFPSRYFFVKKNEQYRVLYKYDMDNFGIPCL